MNNKSRYLIYITIVALLPLIFAVVAYINTPIITTTVQNDQISNHFLTVATPKFDSVLTTLRENTFFNTKNLVVLISIYPLIVYLHYLIKYFKLDNYNKLLLHYFILIKLVYIDITFLVLYGSIGSYIDFGQLTFYILLACYFLMLALFCTSLPPNRVIGFHSRFTNYPQVHKLSNKVYAIFLFICAILFIALPFIFKTTIIALFSIYIFYFLAYITTYICSYIFYRYERQDDAKVYQE